MNKKIITRIIQQTLLFGILIVLSVFTANTSRAQIANAISVQFTFGAGYDTNLSLLPGEITGVVPLQNWNNLITGSGGGYTWVPPYSFSSLQDSLAANSGANLVIDNLHNGWHSGGTITVTNSPSVKMLFQCLEVNNNPPYPNTNHYTFSSLPATTYGAYDLYVYVNSQDQRARMGIVCTNDGIAYYVSRTSASATNNQVFIQGNNTVYGNFPAANYVLFSGVPTSGGVISFGLFQVENGNTGTDQGGQGGVAGIQLVPSSFTAVSIVTQPASQAIVSGGSATFNVVAMGVEFPSYYWYRIKSGATNLINGATTSSYTTNGETASDSFFVVVSNSVNSVTSSVANVLIGGAIVDGAWSDASGAGNWGTSGNWLDGNIAYGMGSTAYFTNSIPGAETVALNANWAVGTNFFGTNNSTGVQPSWTINPGSPAGALYLQVPGTLAIYDTNGNFDVVLNAPVISVASNTTATINAPLAGNNGLIVNGGGKLVLAGNNTYTGPTIIGFNKADDVTEVQIGNGGTSGSLDFNHANDIHMAGYTHLIFNRSDTITVSNIFNCAPVNAANVIVNSGTVILAPPANHRPWLGAVVNSGGTLVLNCPSNAASPTAINNSGGSINVTNGTPRTVAQGNAGGTGLAINSGGTVKLAGPGGNGINIANGVGVLNNGIFDLGGVPVQIGYITGTGTVTNSGATVATLSLNSTPQVGFPWAGSIVNGASAQTSVRITGGTGHSFNSANPYTGDTRIDGGSLILSNSASIGSANIILAGGNLILTNGTPTLSNPNATIYVGSGRTLDIGGVVGGFTLGSAQTLIVTNTGIVRSNLTAAGTIIPGGTGAAGTMNVNVGGLTLNANTNNFDLAAVTTEGGGVNDEIIVNGDLTLQGNIRFNLNTNFNNNLASGSIYKLIKYTGALNSNSSPIITIVPSVVTAQLLNVTLDITNNPGYISLDMTGTPGPPSVTGTSSTNVAAFVGLASTLSVTAVGFPAAQYQWYGGPGAGTLIANATNASFTFTPAVSAPTNYYCDVFNNQGSTNVYFVVTVYPSLAISAQFALDNITYQTGSHYLAPADSAGVAVMSNWNVLGKINPNNGGNQTIIAAGIISTNLVASNGVVTTAVLTTIGVQDGWEQNGADNGGGTPDLALMNTFWKVNLGHTPPTNTMYLTFTNLPTDNYDAYVYLMQNIGGQQGYLYSQGVTNYFAEFTHFSAGSNYVTGTNLTGTGTIPPANYILLNRLSTGATNGFSINAVSTSGGDGIGISGIQIVPSDPAPLFLLPPASANINVGTVFTNTVLARGRGTLYYQWYQITGGVTNTLSNGGHISGATNTSLVLNSSQNSDNGGYYVVVTNAYASVTSSVASLTVYTAPVITAQSPPSVRVYTGRNPRFYVTAVGPPPLYYQWKTNTVVATGTTNSTLTLTNAQAGNNNETFVCVVTNSFGSITSSVATLTVIAPPADAYAVAVLGNNPMAYFRLNEYNLYGDNSAGNNGTNAYDYVGGNNGIYSNVVLNATGFPYSLPLPANTDGSATFGTFATPNSYAGGIPIDFATPTNQNAAFSVEAWVNGSGPSPNAGFVSKGYGAGGEQFCLSASTGGSNFTFFVRDAATGAAHQVSTANTPFAFGNWFHLVGVCDEANSSVVLYVNGQQIGTAAITAGSGLLSSTLPVAIGARQSSQAPNHDSQLVGTVDEVAIYNYALSSNQVQSHYLATGIAPIITVQPPANVTNNEGSTFTVSVGAFGSPTLTYQWYDYIAGTPWQPGVATNATLVINNVNAGNTGFGVFYLQVANAYGSIFSGPVALNINQGPPVFGLDLSPTNLTVYQGSPVTYTAIANGTGPIRYQWFTNAISAINATNSSYAFNALLGTNTYNVRMTNAQGTLNSSTGRVVGVVRPTDTYALAVLSNSPIAYWRLDENNGTIAYDYVGGHNGIYNNVTLQAAGFNPLDPDKAVSFGGSGSSYVGPISGFDFSLANGGNRQFSVELWCNGPATQPAAGADGPGLISQGPPAADSWGIDTDANALGTGFRFNTHNAAGAWVHPQTTPTPAPDGQWHHLVGVCDEAGGTVYLYVDGVPTTAAIAAGSGFTTTANTAPVYIGARNSPANDGTFPQYFLGTIDEVAIYDYALSSNQVAAHYAIGSTTTITLNIQPSGTNLVLTWNVGTLQSATNVAGPYTTNGVAGATSPYTNAPTGAQKFYRVRFP